MLLSSFSFRVLMKKKITFFFFRKCCRSHRISRLRCYISPCIIRGARHPLFRLERVNFRDQWRGRLTLGGNSRNGASLRSLSLRRRPRRSVFGKTRSRGKLKCDIRGFCEQSGGFELDGTMRVVTCGVWLMTLFFSGECLTNFFL